MAWFHHFTLESCILTGGIQCIGVTQLIYVLSHSLGLGFSHQEKSDCMPLPIEVALAGVLMSVK